MPMTFRPISFDEANPFLAGFSRAKQLEAQDIQNAYNRAQAQFAPASLQADIYNKFMEAKRNEKMANLPFGGQMPTGPAGQIYGIELLKSLYGENDPRVKQAQAILNLQQDRIQSNIDWQSFMRNDPTALNRFYSSQGKLQNEQSGKVPTPSTPSPLDLMMQVPQNNTPQSRGVNVATQWMPQDANMPELPPLQKPSVSAPAGMQAPMQSIQMQANVAKNLAENNEKHWLDYQRAIEKSTLTPQVINKANSALAAETTMSKIDPHALTKYAGLLKKYGKTLAEIEAGRGANSREYTEFKKARQNMQMLAAQIQQFETSSVAESTKHEFQKLVDTDEAFTNPKLAEELFLDMRDTIKREALNYINQVPSVKYLYDKMELAKDSPYEKQRQKVWSKSEIQSTARQFGISEEQVKQFIAKKGGRYE